MAFTLETSVVSSGHAWGRTLGEIDRQQGKARPVHDRTANALNVSFRISLRWPIHIINPVDKLHYLVILPTDAAPQFL